MPSAVLILGNPKYFDAPYVKPFYQSIVSFLKELGYSVKVVPSDPGTEIPPADLWVGHSRGTGFLSSAPPGVKTIGFGYSDGIYHPKDNAATLTSRPPPGWHPNKYHFTFTDEMKDALRKATDSLEKTAASSDVVYSAVILDNPRDLVFWWKSEVGDLLSEIHSHHMTITFRPSEEEINKLPLGRKVQLKVDGYIEDEHAQVVRVRGYSSSKPVAHITVATEGESPSYSNELLASGRVIPVDGPVLHGHVGVRTAGGEFKYAEHDPSRNDYQNEYQKNRYHERKRMAIKMLGGKCSVCGTTRNLELDHKNPKNKKFTITKLWSVPESEFKTEVRKCRLLCHKHHLENSAKQREKGTVKSVPGKSEYDSKNRKKAEASHESAARKLAEAVGSKYACPVVKDTDFDKGSHIDKPVIVWNAFDPDEKEEKHQLLLVVYGREKDTKLVHTLVHAVKKGMTSLGADLEYVDDRQEPGLLSFAVSSRL